MTDPITDPTQPANVGHLLELRKAIVDLDAASAAEFRRVADRLEELPAGGLLADLQGRLKAVEDTLRKHEQRLLNKGA